MSNDKVTILTQKSVIVVAPNSALPGGGGVSDHGALTGLADDDHTQYALADGSRGSFATAAQGALADSAVQPGGALGTPSSGTLTNCDGYPINIVDDTTPELGGAMDGRANEIGLFVNKVVSLVSGLMTAAAHGGCMVVTSGNVTVPTTAGFSAIIISGGAHTVTFNGAVSPAMATGDIMTVAVQSSTVVHAVLTAAADKVQFA